MVASLKLQHELCPIASYFIPHAYLISVLFPPIPSLSCDRGRAHLSWEFNQVENMNYSFTRIYQNEKAYYPEGGCLSEERQPIYEVMYIKRPPLDA